MASCPRCKRIDSQGRIRRGRRAVLRSVWSALLPFKARPGGGSAAEDVDARGRGGSRTARRYEKVARRNQLIPT